MSDLPSRNLPSDGPSDACPNPDTRSRVMIVDGHPLFRRGLADLLANQPDLAVAAEAETLIQARRLLAATPIDLLILEMDLPDGNGLDLLATGARSYDPICGLVLTSLNEEPFALTAVEAGACGFVGKQEPTTVILNAIRQVLSRKTYLPATVLNRLLRAGTDSPHEFRGIGQLSAREKEVFSLLGEGLTAKEIATRLGMSVHTVDTHRERMKKKLKLSNGATLTRHAVEWRLKCNLSRQVELSRRDGFAQSVVD